MSDGATDNSTDHVRVLSRGLSILHAFTPRNGWLSNHEIATAVELPRPTVSRITANLTSAGYLLYSPGRAQYRLSSAAVTLGFAAFASLDIRVVARPFLRELANGADALAVIAMRDDMHMVCNEVFHGAHILTLRLAAGSRLSLVQSAMGRALIGALPDEQRTSLLGQIAQRFPDEWTRLRVELDDAVEQTRSTGFCATIGTAEEGVNGVGSVINVPRAPNIYVLGCAAPAFRFSPQRLNEEIGPRLLDIKHQIEQQLSSTVG
jgi:DNA-binding IclR family transcriptional regulator